ncbi:hypothetical protein MASR2M47_27030 [Draconibacterium sp.]|jgi:FKBP-type peptidyl-prolyl cis-trans isomerase
MKLNKTMKNIFAGLVFIAVVVGIFACGNDNSLEELRNNELAKLNTYMKANYPDVKPKPSGLYFIEQVKGTGDTIRGNNRVLIYYATWTIDSVLLDQTIGYLDGYRFEPYEVRVGSGTSIVGLEEALTYMQKGAVANLVINSKLAYGQDGNVNGNPPVPGFTTLLMQVEVYKFY